MRIASLLRAAFGCLLVAVPAFTAGGCGCLYSARPRYSGQKVPSRPGRPKPVKPRSVPVLDKRQGKLAWPAVGPVVGTFGVVVDPTYGTKTKKLGLDIKTAKGGPVKAVYDGRVSFADRFMGYGRTVIVDHGDRLHSIYSRLSEIRVSVGDEVKKGEAVAFSGDTLHVQIRKGGKSVDPHPWFVPR